MTTLSFRCHFSPMSIVSPGQRHVFGVSVWPWGAEVPPEKHSVERATDTLLKGCCGLFGGMWPQRCPCPIRVGIAGCVANPIMASFWWGPSLATHRHPHQVPFASGEGRLFRSVGKAGGVRFFWTIRVAGGCEVEACPWLERGLVRVRVRVTLDDGGHRYSQREQLMSDDSHDQLAVPNNLQDERIRATAPANSDGRHETDERIRSQVHLLATDRLSQHTHLQPVAQHRGRGVWC